MILVLVVALTVIYCPTKSVHGTNSPELIRRQKSRQGPTTGKPHDTENKDFSEGNKEYEEAKEIIFPVFPKL